MLPEPRGGRFYVMARTHDGTWHAAVNTSQSAANTWCGQQGVACLMFSTDGNPDVQIGPRCEACDAALREEGHAPGYPIWSHW